MKIAGRIVGTAVAMALVAGLIGFAWFVTRVPAGEVAIAQSADGIVVLTGGASRITDAVELLAAGRGKRLLISGVHPSTGFQELSRRTPAYERLFACCVDLDYSATNTVGNAVQTRRWAQARGFRSLIVVTSNYHMPRSLFEFAREMPDAMLIPFPVVTDRLRSEALWSDPMAMRLLMSEYLKFVLAQLRTHLNLGVDTTSAIDNRPVTFGQRGLARASSDK